jgi:hypothetical protein
VSSHITRFGTMEGSIEDVDHVGEFSLISGNLSNTTKTIRLRGCSFSGAISLTTPTLYADLETFRNMITSGVVLTGVTAFVPLFPIVSKEFGAATATSGQFLLPGGPSAVSTATEGAGQIQTPSSYVVIGIRGRALAQPATITLRKGGVSQALTCSMAASGNANDVAIGHWVSGNADELLGVIVGGTAGGLVRATLLVAYI